MRVPQVRNTAGSREPGSLLSALVLRYFCGDLMRILLSTAAGLLALTGSAFATVIDFEDQSTGTVITTQYGPLLTISADSNGSFDQAMIFDTDNYTGGDNDLDAPFNTPTPGGADGIMPGHVLIISEDGDSNDPDDEAAGGSITFDFASVVEFIGINIFDIDNGENVQVQLLNNGAFIGGATVAGSAIGDGNYISFAETFAYYLGDTLEDYFGQPMLIDQIIVTFSASGALDDLEFAEVPLPGALPLLLSGIAGLGFASRRRKKA